MQMPLTTMKEILVEARKKGYAVGAFEIWSLDSAQAVVEAAQEQEIPVILQAGPLECDFSGMKNIYRIAKMVAEDASIPVALHADHFQSYEDILRAIDAGFTSVMIDASHLSFKENVKLTKRVANYAKSAEVTVEAELGKVGGCEANIDVDEGEATQTNPEEAAMFVKETGIDALAVAIGTAHGFYKSKPKINIGRLKKIAEKVDIPLVLHGGSGTPDDKVVEAIKCGIAKVNICTEFVAAYGQAYTDIQNSQDFKYNIPLLFGTGKQAGKALAAAKIKLFSCR